MSHKEKTLRLSPCILGTVCVPWTDDNAFDEGIFRQATRDLINSGLNNLYLFGTAGEGHAVTTEMYRHIAEAFYDEMQTGGNLCQLGIIAQSIQQIRERIDIGLELGFRSFQISLPSWGKLNDRELIAFFDEVLGGYPEAQFLHYNTARGLRTVTPIEYGRIASDHENLVATKIATKSLSGIQALFRHAPQVCHFFTEFEFSYAGLLKKCGFLISVAALNPGRAQEYFDAVVRKDQSAVHIFTQELSVAHELLFRTCSSGQHMDGAYDKVFLKASRENFPLRLLPPYQGTSDSEFKQYMDLLARELPAWCPRK
jgi:dihydrodipicolinate synthase/N-acetylneuraminate lyase